LNTRKLADEIYRIFGSYPGAEYIASLNAINGVLRIMKTRKPVSVLEVGAGIGTLTHALFEALRYMYDTSAAAQVRIVSTEDNEYCLEQLSHHLPDILQDSRFTLRRTMDDAHADARGFDFIIIDGGMFDDPRYTTKLLDGGVVFVEGDRQSQRMLMQQSGRSFTTKSIISNRRNPDYGPYPTSKYQGGYTVFSFEPGMAEKLSAITQRIVTAAKYRLRWFHAKKG
jgi:protein-L-isoaspartate O-methyltransferase